MERAPILLAGYEALQTELRQLKTVDRIEVVKAIEEARAHGDLSENAEYHAAKDEQGHIEARIKILVDKVSRAEVIDPTTMSGDTVMFGATVTLIDEDDKTIVFQIVSVDEADVTDERISYTSPIGRSLIGRRVEDDVEVITPSGERYFEIVKIEYK